MLLAVDLSGAGHGVWLLLPFFLVHSGGRVSPLRLNTRVYRVAGNMPKRAATDDGDAPKKKMPPMQSTPHASDAAGWCSDPSLKLSPAMLVNLDLNGGVGQCNFPDGPGGVGQCNFPDVPGMSDRWVFQVNPEEAGRVYFVEDAQRYEAKYGHAKYGKKLELMAKDIDRGRGDAACSTLGADKWTVVLLLGRHQPVCRSGCLPAMAKAGIVVQRRAE